jgi:TRAP-type C4-dicarboxylate transport system permease small subunit
MVLKINDLMHSLTGLLNSIASVALLVMMGMTVADVGLRKFAAGGVKGGLELSEFLMVFLVFCALAGCEFKDRNVSVSLLTDRLPGRVQTAIAVLTRLTASIMFCAIAVSLIRYAFSLRALQEVSPDLLIPRYPFIYLAAIGCAILSLVLLIKALTSAGEVLGKWKA